MPWKSYSDEEERKTWDGRITQKQTAFRTRFIEKNSLQNMYVEAGEENDKLAFQFFKTKQPSNWKLCKPSSSTDYLIYNQPEIERHNLAPAKGEEKKFLLKRLSDSSRIIFIAELI